jgi:hypothetical protein
MTFHLFPRGALRGATNLLARRAWRPALLVGLVALGVGGTSLPASADPQPRYFVPYPAFGLINRACEDGIGKPKPSLPSYQDPMFGPGLAAATYDDDGAYTGSTYVKGAQWCRRLDWKFPAAGSSGTCHYWFYVPNDVNVGNTTGIGANATIVLGFYGSDGQTLVAHSDPIDESAVAGYTPLTISGDPNISATFTGLNLGDNNGQPAGSAQIGWGVDVPNSLKRVCP